MSSYNYLHVNICYEGQRANRPKHYDNKSKMRRILGTHIQKYFQNFSRHHSNAKTHDVFDFETTSPDFPNN